MWFQPLIICHIWFRTTSGLECLDWVDSSLPKSISKIYPTRRFLFSVNAPKVPNYGIFADHNIRIGSRYAVLKIRHKMLAFQTHNLFFTKLWNHFFQSNKGNKTFAANYTSIALVSVFSIGMENVIDCQLIKYLENFKTINERPSTKCGKKVFWINY